MLIVLRVEEIDYFHVKPAHRLSSFFMQHRLSGMDQFFLKLSPFPSGQLYFDCNHSERVGVRHVGKIRTVVTKRKKIPGRFVFGKL
jgi:hypothetical protein